ncbi:MAG TPA: alpha/beta hydrolase [Acidimicrobiales bacterium]|nr:alpha/beta hydrolase [Acidimicrobiales bacterium]
MGSADVNGLTIRYEDTGGDGPAVIFSHGFLMDHTMFEPQVAALAPDFRCVTWDERGFGDTPATGPFTYWDSAADALGLLDHLGVESAVFAGMSQGGFLSLRAALTSPARVKALVLIDTQSGTEPAETLPLYQGMHDDWVTNGPSDPLAAGIASIIFGGGYDPAPWIAKWQARDKALLSMPFDCLVGRDDITERLGEITAPAIIFHGDEDAAISMDRAEALAAGLANCVDLVRVAGAGHASNLSHPDAVNGPLLEFMRKYA